MVGAGGDAVASADVRHALRGSPGDRPALTALIDWCGKSDLPTLAGVLVASATPSCRTIPARCTWPARSARRWWRSSAPTNEQHTSPLAGAPRRARRRVMITHDVWCRPCMLRECPIDHVHARRVAPRGVRAPDCRRSTGACRYWPRRQPAAAVFLDRDGTLNVDVGYLHRLEQLELFPWTADALRLLKRAGYPLVVVTNQSGIAPADDPRRFVAELHDEMRRRLAAAARDLDALVLLPASSARARRRS